MTKRISPVRKLSDYYGVKLKMSETAKHKLAKEVWRMGWEFDLFIHRYREDLIMSFSRIVTERNMS